MINDSSFSHLLAGGDPLYALQEPGRTIDLHWGARDGQQKESLCFQKFYFPEEKTPSVWGDFPPAATFSLTGKRSFKPREFTEAPPLPLPAAEPPIERADWNLLCQKAAASIQCDNAFKLVPARKKTYPLLPQERKAILGALTHRLFFPKVENAYRFLIKSGGSIFFGATPELLFKRENGEIHVPAIAGTRALSDGIPESSLREELLASTKDRLEHDWVVEGIMESLQSLGLNPSHPGDPQVLRTARLLHLYTPISAKDQGKLSSEDLLRALHPTPAIGGQPKAAALEFLFENEHWDRGLFSAPLHFRGGGRELCLVAIRSALLTSTELHFFAGAGYVKGSTAQSEWLETERKIQVMESILFGDENARK